MQGFRTHTCADLNATNVGQTVRLSGWVHRVRDHGGILFIDLRDHYGVTQVLADPDSPAFSELEKVRSEWCIRIDGEVKARAPELVNKKLPTGEVEIFIRDMEVLGASEELPLQVFDEPDFPEETRLKYRFLDLRRETLHNNIILRSNVVKSIRNRMGDQGFNEFQTPIITASSPEGARDFLVPSRQHPGKFYALPQAPQQFKQMIMVAGFDKYFQIAIAPWPKTGRKSPTRTRHCGTAQINQTCVTQSKCKSYPITSAALALQSSRNCWKTKAPKCAQSQPQQVGHANSVIA